MLLCSAMGFGAAVGQRRCATSSRPDAPQASTAPWSRRLHPAPHWQRTPSCVGRIPCCSLEAVHENYPCQSHAPAFKAPHVPDARLWETVCPPEAATFRLPLDFLIGSYRTSSILSVLNGLGSTMRSQHRNLDII